jgi:hypothetical protein
LRTKTCEIWILFFEPITEDVHAVCAVTLPLKLTFRAPHQVSGQQCVRSMSNSILAKIASTDTNARPTQLCRMASHLVTRREAHARKDSRSDRTLDIFRQYQESSLSRCKLIRI